MRDSLIVGLLFSIAFSMALLASSERRIIQRLDAMLCIKAFEVGVPSKELPKPCRTFAARNHSEGE